MLIRHLSKTGAGIETPDNAKGDTDAKASFLCHAIAQPYVAFSSRSMVVLAGLPKGRPVPFAPVVSTQSVLPPLRLRPHAVAP